MKQPEWVNKLAALEKRIAQERGAFSLFALFQQEGGSFGKWDLVFAAPWADPNLIDALYYVGKILQASLTSQEMASISMIAPVPTQDPGVEEVLDSVSQEHGLAELRDKDFFGKPIKRAFVITAKNPQPLPA